MRHFSLFRPALPIALLIALAMPARADVAGPDFPGWARADAMAQADPADLDDARSASLDLLDPIRAKLGEAQEHASAGRESHALETVDAGLRDLNEILPAPPGVSALREQLEATRNLARTALEKKEREKEEEKAKDKNRPPRLDPIVPVRNAHVEKWIAYYTGRGREHFQKWLSRSGNYMDLLTQNLRAEGVPEELANLVFVESGFNMHAKSVARAVGPWQFIRGTAKLFGLEITPYVDERRDPELATRAAARYLRRLYTIFDGSWPLALAAYNSGEGTVLRAIKRQKTTDFWSLKLPRETREYVPKFMAAMEVASDPERYGFTVPENSPWRADAVVVRGPVDLKLVSRLSDVPMEELSRLNPSFVRHRAPAGGEGTTIRVPHGSGKQVQEILDASYQPKPLSKSELRAAAKAHRLEIRHSRRVRRSGSTHVVRRGETLSQIAVRHGTSTTRLAELNRIPTNGMIRAGQRLRVR